MNKNKQFYSTLFHKLQYEVGIKTYNHQFLNGYFIFEMEESAVTHFKIKGLKWWKFAIWKQEKDNEVDYTLFCQLEKFIDKFKPSRSNYFVNFKNIDDINNIVDLIKDMKKNKLKYFFDEFTYDEEFTKVKGVKALISGYVSEDVYNFKKYLVKSKENICYYIKYLELKLKTIKIKDIKVMIDKRDKSWSPQCSLSVEFDKNIGNYNLDNVEKVIETMNWNILNERVYTPNLYNKDIKSSLMHQFIMDGYLRMNQNIKNELQTISSKLNIDLSYLEEYKFLVEDDDKTIIGCKTRKIDEGVKITNDDIEQLIDFIFEKDNWDIELQSSRRNTIKEQF
jgi:hypothetical protein